MKCCLCGKEIHGLGNNPWPVDKTDEARCCDDCNMLTVVPARLAELVDGKRKHENDKKRVLDIDEYLDKMQRMRDKMAAAERMRDEAAEEMASYLYNPLRKMTQKDIEWFLDEATKRLMTPDEVLPIVGAWAEYNGFEFAFIESMAEMIEELDRILGGDDGEN